MAGPFLHPARDEGEEAGEKAFHVGTAAAIEALGLSLSNAAQEKGVTRPLFGLGRHHVGVPGKEEPSGAVHSSAGRTSPGRCDAGKEAEAVFVGAVDATGRETAAGEVLFDIRDEGLVRAPAHGGKGDEIGEELDRPFRGV